MRHGATHALDKWQALPRPRGGGRTEPGLQGHCFLFFLIFPLPRTAAFFTRAEKKRMNVKTIKEFFKKDIWYRDYGDKPFYIRFAVGMMRMLYLAIEGFTTKRMISSSAALTNSTLLAIVPIIAVVFAIARGFGYNAYIEEGFRHYLESQPQVAETIIGFVNSYLKRSQSEVILGIGLVFMVGAVTMLISAIEQEFNRIWQVNKQRSFFRRVTDYMGILIFAPFVIVITAGLSIFVATFAKDTENYILLAPMAKVLLRLSPYILTSAIFIALYAYMPNTKVKIRSVIGPGILAGMAMQGLQFVYIHSQIWVSSYNAIYGSFTAVPLFMIWVQISWNICLFGVELCYANQNMEEVIFRTDSGEISPRYRLVMSMALMSHICKRFEEGGKPYTAFQLKQKTNIPIRVVQELLYELTRINVLNEISGDEKVTDSMYQPAEALQRLSVGLLIDRFESTGKWDISLDLKEAQRDKWNMVLANHKRYIEAQRDILLKDL